MSKHIQYTITPASTGLIISVRGRFLSVFPTKSTRSGNGAKTVRLGRVSIQFGNVEAIQRPVRSRAATFNAPPTSSALPEDNTPVLPGLESAMK